MLQSTPVTDTTNFLVVHADVSIISSGFFFSHSDLLALLCDQYWYLHPWGKTASQTLLWVCLYCTFADPVMFYGGCHEFGSPVLAKFSGEETVKQDIEIGWTCLVLEGKQNPSKSDLHLHRIFAISTNPRAWCLCPFCASGITRKSKYGLHWGNARGQDLPEEWGWSSLWVGQNSCSLGQDFTHSEPKTVLTGCATKVVMRWWQLNSW